MSYNEQLIRALLGLAMTWIMATAFFNHRITMIKRDFRKTIGKQEQELRRLRQLNAELSWEKSKKQ